MNSKNSLLLPSKGFTLLELLITMTLFSVIMMILMNTYFNFTKQSTILQNKLTLRQEMRGLQQLLREDLQAAIFLEEFMKNVDQNVDLRKSGIYGLNSFIGDKDNDELHLHVNRPSRFYRLLDLGSDPEIHEVSYFLKEIEDGKFKLKRREEFYIDTDITTGDRGITYTLSTSVTSFDIKYFQLETKGDGVVKWDSSSRKAFDGRMPAAVSVSLELVDESGEKLASTFEVNLKPLMGIGIEWN